jgi:hypothetical protein
VPGGSLAWSRGTDRRTVGSMARPTFKRAVVATLAAAAVLVSPTTAGAASYDPPSWFKNGAEKVKARPGAKCPGPKPFTRTRTIPGDLYDVTIRVEGTTEDCFHRLPKALAKSFQVLRPPLSDHPYREGCYGEYRHQTYPDDPGAGWTDSTWFRCDIFSRPVMEGRPNPRTWQCWRSKFFRHVYRRDEPDEFYRGGKPFWFAEETKYWQDQRFKSLSRCLNPKYRKPK